MAKLPNPLYLVFTSPSFGDDGGLWAGPEATLDYWSASFNDAVRALQNVASEYSDNDEPHWIYQIVRLRDHDRVSVASGRIQHGALIPDEDGNPREQFAAMKAVSA